MSAIERLRHRYHLLRARLRNAGSRIRPGARGYDRHVAEEIEHYTDTFDGDPRLIEPAPPVWEEVQRRAGELIRAKTGDDLFGHLVRRLTARAGVRLLSLGSGPGGVELALAREAPAARIACMDLNAELLDRGRRQAAGEGLAVEFEAADLNVVALPAGAFDVVFCHASLHHLVELERLFEQIRRALAPGGELIVVEVITRNGYRMWPETKRLVDTIWATLPERYRVNHTAYPGQWVDKRIWESDTSLAGMECARSEEILPLLRKHFREEVFVAYLALCRRFFDTMYGPNYDPLRPLDRAILDWIWQLDCQYLETGRLRGETMFGVYRAPC
jgi:ubiquinone/menaquinone biosynthesis C-methylase UbiE